MPALFPHKASTSQNATVSRNRRYRLIRMKLQRSQTGPIGLLKGFLSEREDPETFYRALAARTIEELPYRLDGARILDLGCGTGWFSRALTDAGATVIGVDLDADDVREAHSRANVAMIGDGRCLPFADATFDGVFCSNLLEHTPNPDQILADSARVVRSDGWVWLSWTVWYGPWGGHAIAPFHYLGPRLGLRIYTKLRGVPKGKNLPFVRLWPTHVGQVLKIARANPNLRLVDAHPRYWRSQRWIMKVPALREVLSWNCVLHFVVNAPDRPIA